MAKKVYTTGEVATLCRAAPRTVSKWVDSGRLKGYRLPNSRDRRIPHDDLLRFMLDQGIPLGELSVVRCRILLVGVEEVLSAPLRAVLPSHQFAIIDARDPFEAGQMLQGTQPDIAVVDLRIGRAEALQIATHVRSARCIAIACEDETDVGGLKRHGFANVLPRPFPPQTLTTLVCNLVSA